MDGRGNIYGYASPRDHVEYQKKDVFGAALTWQGPKTIAWLLGTDGMAVHDRFASNDTNQRRAVMQTASNTTITSSDLRYRWQTKYEELVPLIFFGKRYFHPQLGRFIQRDPIGTAGGRNLYAFAGNDPVNFTDPRGESAVAIDQDGGTLGELRAEVEGERAAFFESRREAYFSTFDQPERLWREPSDGAHFGGASDPTRSAPAWWVKGAADSEKAYEIMVRFEAWHKEQEAVQDFLMGAHIDASPLIANSRTGPNVPRPSPQQVENAMQRRIAAERDPHLRARFQQELAHYRQMHGLGTPNTSGGPHAVIRAPGPQSRSARLGLEGERLVGIVGPKTRIHIPGTGRYRTPDRLTPQTLTEVKNVAYQSYTQQLRDYVLYASQPDIGRNVELFVRPSTVLSRPLVEAAARGEIILRHIPSP